MNNKELFQVSLAHQINIFSIDNELNTPDYILAEYIMNCLENYRKINEQREKWHGR